MALELCILGSGSSGNCSLLRTPTGVMLIDAGLGPRTVGRRLNGTGVQLAQVGAICVTHLDRDHFTPAWRNRIIDHGVRVYCHETRVRQLHHRALDGEDDPSRRSRFRSLVSAFDGKAFEPMRGVRMHAIHLAHDREGSHGFVIEGFGSRIGYATDLGHVPAELINRFENVDVLAIESNYDPQMQIDSPRPIFLKRRIMGGSGHLSNEQAFDAVRQILDRCERNARPLPQHIVLLHRSRQCNCPKLLRKFFARDARVLKRLTLADQFEPSGWLRIRPSPPAVHEQLTLGFA